MELLTYAFDSTCTFMFERCQFEFEGREFVLISGTDKYCEVVQTIIEHPKERGEAFQIIHKFLFCFGWANNCKFSYRGHMAEGLARPIDLFKRSRVLYIKRNYRNLLVGFEHIISPTTYEQEVALSLYNDAQYLSNIFSKFVCYWKILEIPFANRKLKATDWVNNAINNRFRIHKTDFIKDLVSQNKDVGTFFKKKCRNAIFHITRKPTVVSFKAEDCEQIGHACDGIEPFVLYFIKKELRLPQRYDVVKILKKKR